MERQEEEMVAGLHRKINQLRRTVTRLALEANVDAEKIAALERVFREARAAANWIDAEESDIADDLEAALNAAAQFGLTDENGSTDVAGDDA